MRTNAKRVSTLGIACALCMVLGYIEHLVPFPVGIYGLKLGLANLGIVSVLYLLGAPAAILLNLVRIVLSSLLFGNSVSLAYSLCGGMLSVLAMSALKRIRRLSSVGVSTVGGIVHNAAQLCVAVFMVDSLKIAILLPLLLGVGAFTGFIIGIVSLPLVKNKHLIKICKG